MTTYQRKIKEEKETKFCFILKMNQLTPKTSDNFDSVRMIDNMRSPNHAIRHTRLLLR